MEVLRRRGGVCYLHVNTVTIYSVFLTVRQLSREEKEDIFVRLGRGVLERVEKKGRFLYESGYGRREWGQLPIS